MTPAKCESCIDADAVAYTFLRKISWEKRTRAMRVLKVEKEPWIQSMRTWGDIHQKNRQIDEEVERVADFSSHVYT